MGHNPIQLYQKERLLRHIREKRDGRFTSMGVMPHVTLQYQHLHFEI